MSAKKKLLILFILFCSWPLLGISPAIRSSQELPLTPSWAQQTVAEQLGWITTDENYCGGYYLDPAFNYPVSREKKHLVKITGKTGLLSQQSTSFLEDGVRIERFGQLITSDQAFVYRNTAGKLNVIDMIGDVHLREPNALIVARRGRYNLETKAKSLLDILYRISLHHGPTNVTTWTEEEILHERKMTGLTAWGTAHEFSQIQPRVYELSRASFTTCPPLHPAWQVRASHILLDKNTGRGYARHARFLIKNYPVLYTPYISFSIDKQRKSGLLWPTMGLQSSEWGPYILLPFYWNMAPNYDMTITPALLSKRGIQLSETFRYLTWVNEGNIDFSVLPRDREFARFQKESLRKYGNSQNPIEQAELNRLLSDSTTRKAFSWRDDAHFNEHWSSHVDFSYAGDDYYLKNFGSNLNEITQNQLLQEADLYFKSENWNFIGRMQAYQTLHPLGEPLVRNNYRRFPQLILNGDFPDQRLGFEYFIYNEVTHFDVRKTPGFPENRPIGNRLHTQPGISLPLYWPFFYFNPRFQVALTNYNLYKTAGTDTPNSIRRAVPIFDIVTGFAFNRNLTLFGNVYRQTLEPQIYYTFIPYRNQSDIPIFDTTVNTLTYDQIFNYNRFSGLDRIGDANQIGIGITTRLIDQMTGLEKAQLGIGEIFYFSDRRVTFCNDNSCVDNPNNPINKQRLSPISGLFRYFLNPAWSFNSNAIWNPITQQLDNTSIAFHYQPDPAHILNLGFNFARGGDPLSGIETKDSDNNLKVTTISFAMPIMRDINMVGLWSQNWNHQHLQNLLYGLQYDTCCWAVRLVGGRAFVGLKETTNQPNYTNQFYIQFALKGLGNIGSGNPSRLLSSINGYNTQFGQEL